MKQFNLKSVFVIFLLVFLTSVNAQTIKVLAIGNSFSEDALQEYVDDLAAAGGVQVVVGNLYWGGCDLQTHWNNATTNNPGYSYRKVVNGVLTTLDNKSIEFAVKDDDWDYISFQQVSQYSGKYSTYLPYLTNLLNYVKGKATNPNVKYCMHRTWAYAANSTHSDYDYYQSNQKIMYDSIVIATNKAAAKVGISIIIPAGTAIQNARSSFIGDNLNRDGYHLTYGLGRYVAACAWYEKIFGKTVIGNTFIPTGVSKTEANVAQYAAHYANTTSDAVTPMTSFVANPTVGLVKQVDINFGDKIALSPWNNLSGVGLNSSVSGLMDIDGNNTGVSITVNDAFHAINGSGPAATTTNFNIPPESSSQSFYGNGIVWETITEPTGGFLLAGLDATKQYDFYFFSSRNGVSDNRETTFTLTGSTVKTGSVNSSSNTTDVLAISQLTPQSNGTISISLAPGANNNNANKFFYVNSLIIKPYDTPSSVENVVETKLRLYPNPVKDIAVLDAEQLLGSVSVCDLSGRIILVFDDIVSTKKEIDLRRIKSGCYLLKQQNRSMLFMKK